MKCLVEKDVHLSWEVTADWRALRYLSLHVLVVQFYTVLQDMVSHNTCILFMLGREKGG